MSTVVEDRTHTCVRDPSHRNVSTDQRKSDDQWAMCSSIRAAMSLVGAGKAHHDTDLTPSELKECLVRRHIYKHTVCIQKGSQQTTCQSPSVTHIDDLSMSTYGSSSKKYPSSPIRIEAITSCSIDRR